MTATLEPELDLATIEERAADHLAQPATEPEDVPLEEWEQEPPLPPLRVGLVVACSTVAAAVMAGGLFEGTDGRIYPALAGLCGVAIAAQASRRKSALWANVTIVVGLFATGVVLVLPTGLDNVTHLVSVLKEAKGASKVLRPPAEFLPGWRMVIGWIMASIGFAAGWVGIEMRRPALGLLVPLPAIAYAAISVPEAAKLPSGIAAAVLFIVGLGLLSSAQNLIEGGENAPGLGYEVRRAARALPLLLVVVIALVGLSRTNVLFPKPRYDPTKNAQAPKAVPLSKVKDRVLFTVASQVSGPWRIGILDVYAGNEWRIPAFAESRLQKVPASGVVDDDLEPGARADFVVQGLGGAVLPGMPNTVGIIAKGPRLTYDRRTGNIRLAQGQIRAGLTYTVTAAALPTEGQLQQASGPLPRDVKRSLEMPPPPPEVEAVLEQAPKAPLWDRLEFVRQRLLHTVTAAGPGTPKPIPPAKVVDMLTGSKEGSPFDIVAAEAMLARWAGVPARIGYGFDGGIESSAGVREVRPRHGASWLEVWFPGYEWLPLIGSPVKAKTSLQSEGPTNADPNVVPSDDIAVQVYFPLRTHPSGELYRQIQKLVLFALPVLLVLLLLWVTWPAVYKAVRRSRARARADRAGPQAQVAHAYAEFRDLCADLGFGHESDTPLAYVSVLVDDEEHFELSWLVTRVIWGDLRRAPTVEQATDATELARSLKKRVAQAQPFSLRVIAAVSRVSLRRPYAPELALVPAGEDEDVAA